MFSKQAFKDVIVKYEPKRIEFFQEDRVGLKAIICIYSTALGPALGGARIFPYQSDQAGLKIDCRLLCLNLYSFFKILIYRIYAGRIIVFY